MDQGPDDLAQASLEAPLPMWVFDRHTLEILDVDEAALAFYGYSREEFLALDITDFRPAEDRQWLLDHLSRPSPGPADADVWVHYSRDGRPHRMALFYRETTFKDRPAVLVTAMPLADAPWRQDEEPDTLSTLDNRIFEALPGGVILVALDGSVLYTNRRAREVFGFGLAGPRRLEELHRYTADEGGAPLDAKAFPARACLESGEPQPPRVVQVRRPGLEPAWVVLTAVPNRHRRRGTLLGVVVTFLDITDRKRAEEELQASRTRFSQLFEAVPDGVVVHDGGTILQANRAMQDLFGYAPGELVGQPVERLAVLADHAFLRSTTVSRDTLRYEVEGRRKDGTVVLVGCHSRLFPEAGARVRVLVFRDISDRKRREQELVDEQAFTQAILDSLPGLFYAVSEDDRLIRWNQAVEDLTGRSAEDLAHTNGLTLLDPRDRETGMRVRQETFETGNSEAELRITTRRGMSVPYACYSRRIQYRGEPILLGTAFDLSLRIRAEEGRKLESLNTLAGGMAHDFSNLLTGASGNLELADMSLDDQAAAHRYLDAAEKALGRAGRLVRELLAVSGQGHMAVKTLDLNTLVLDTTGMFQGSLPPAVKLRLELDGPLPPVEADAAQVQQALSILLANASEALGTGPGEISIRTVLCAPEEAQGECLDHQIEAPGLARGSGRYLILAVHDTGPGIPEDQLRRVFDPFYSTKFTGRGLGLSLLTGIMKGHRGCLTVESHPGEGSTFRLLFPVATPAAAQADGHGDLILVVDPKEDMRQVLTLILERLGYRVLAMATGQEGLAALRAHEGEVLGLLLDPEVPDMDLQALTREARAVRPGLPIIATNEPPAPVAHLDGMLPRPFRLPVVSEVLARMKA